MYYLFIVLIGAESPVELAVTRYARGITPVLHGRSRASARPFIPVLGWTMVAVVAASTAVRWWCVSLLGMHWNPRLIIVPGAPLVRSGPYRWLHHPNYTAVAAEVAALPLVHSASVTAIVFSIANALVLKVRIRAEDTALGYA